MLNKVIMMGRMTKDPELRRTGANDAVASFSIAVDRDIPNKQTGQRETDFIDCVAWKGTGEFISRNFRKGAQICVSGRLQIRKWTDKNGNNRASAEVIVENAYFAGAKGDAGNNASGNAYPETEALLNAYGAKADDYAMLNDDDARLPF